MTALETFIDVWTSDTLLDDIATQLTCSEADALAALLREHGADEAADSLIDSHADGDDEGDEHFRGDS